MVFSWTIRIKPNLSLVRKNAVIEKNALVEAEAFPTDDRVTYKDSTYEIISTVAYLIGVPKRIFDNEHEACLLYTSRCV